VVPAEAPVAAVHFAVAKFRPFTVIVATTGAPVKALVTCPVSGIAAAAATEFRPDQRRFGLGGGVRRLEIGGGLDQKGVAPSCICHSSCSPSALGKEMLVRSRSGREARASFARKLLSG